MDALQNRMYKKIANDLNITLDEVILRVEKAKLWHNPLNYTDGLDIKSYFGWSNTFTEVLNNIGHGNRFYFKFKEYNLTEFKKVLGAFLGCKNMDYYLEVWKQYAPIDLKHKYIYLLAITEITQKGFIREKNIIEELIKEGKRVEQASFEEDYYRGIDIYVDGKPVQIKSEATLIRM